MWHVWMGRAGLAPWAPCQWFSHLADTTMNHDSWAMTHSCLMTHRTRVPSPPIHSSMDCDWTYRGKRLRIWVRCLSFSVKCLNLYQCDNVAGTCTGRTYIEANETTTFSHMPIVNWRVIAHRSILYDWLPLQISERPLNNLHIIFIICLTYLQTLWYGPEHHWRNFDN